MNNDSLVPTQEIRCFCSRSPLLAMFGVGEDKRLFVHIRIYKQQRLFGEYVLRGGEVNIKCRDCFRWHSILIKDGKPAIEQSVQPQELGNEAPLYVEFSASDD